MPLHDKDSREDKAEAEALYCPICCGCPGRPEDMVSIGSCSHQFCYGCISRWMEEKQVCPLCKHEFNEIIFSDGRTDRRDTVTQFGENRTRSNGTPAHIVAQLDAGIATLLQTIQANLRDAQADVDRSHNLLHTIQANLRVANDETLQTLTRANFHDDAQADEDRSHNLPSSVIAQIGALIDHEMIQAYRRFELQAREDRNQDPPSHAIAPVDSDSVSAQAEVAQTAEAGSDGCRVETK